MQTTTKHVRRSRLGRPGSHSSVSSVSSLPKAQDEDGMEEGAGTLWKQHILEFEEKKISRRELYELLRECFGAAVFQQTRTSYDNMKQRCKHDYADLDPRLAELPSFIKHMGPRGRKSDTIERRDNQQGYSPENCIWADKRVQANNRSNTVLLADLDGTTLPLTEWALRTGQSPATLRSRRAKGWPDHEVIHGREGSGYDRFAISPWPPGQEEKFEREFRMTGGRTDAERMVFLLDISSAPLQVRYDEAEYISDRLLDDSCPELEDRLATVNSEIDCILSCRRIAKSELKRLRIEQAKSALSNRESWRIRYNECLG